MLPAELGSRLLTPVDLVHNVELELTAVGASGHRGSFGAVSLRADGGEVPCLLVRSWGVIPTWHAPALKNTTSGRDHTRSGSRFSSGVSAQARIGLRTTLQA
ncbi:hypothetical protein DAETH_01850 [Deinococcus aetherius]|uniref:Uncharacterized protein n=1 Tax=Deinococcus aetherius TaxID=200252 RepID=A0ABM8A938_9DEIO|nr:hypothetical protein DAETH_01850 [Deinococcus aetherius]